MFTAFQSPDEKHLNDGIERSRAYQKAYYQKNREKKLSYAKDYLSVNKDRINFERRKRARENGVRERNHLLTDISCKDKSAYNKVYYYERRALKSLSDKIKAMQIVSGIKKPICCNCGEVNIFTLCINHKNGGGRKEFFNGAYQIFIKKILSYERDVADLDVRCHNCNILYEYERGYRKFSSGWEDMYKELTE